MFNILLSFNIFCRCVVRTRLGIHGTRILVPVHALLSGRVPRERCGMTPSVNVFPVKVKNENFGRKEYALIILRIGQGSLIMLTLPLEPYHDKERN